MLVLELLGSLSLRDDTRVVALAAQQKRPLRLLAVLALGGKHGVSRSRIEAWFWPESSAERARHALDQAVYAIRRALGIDLILSTGQELRLDPESIRADVWEFERAIHARDWAAAVPFYKGPLLDGCDLGASHELEAWIDTERARLLRDYQTAIESLAERAAAAGDHAQHVALRRKLAGSDPFSAGATRKLMLALAAAGDRAGAVQHARQYQELVRRELEIEPDAGIEGLAATLSRSSEAENVVTPAMPVDADSARVPDRPRPVRPTRSRMAALATVSVMAVLVMGALVLRLGRKTPAPAEPVHSRTAIAVLPFENLSADGPHAYFAGGLQDEILTQLSKVGALTVISRTSVMSYAHTNPPLRQVARELGVGSVVEGSVQVVGDRLRVNVQLIDAATDTHVWGERYDRTLDDAFAIQSEVAERIVAAVGAALSGAERQGLAAPPTANAEAYRLYVQGRQYWTRPGRDRVNYEAAQQLYERALALDPRFALARAALSEVHGLMYWFSYDKSPTRAARQRTDAETALRLAPDLPEAHVAMGLMHYWGRRDYRRALAELDLALKGLPNDAELWTFVGLVHRRLGDWDKALQAFESATRLAPRDANLFWDLGGYTYQFLHRYAEAARADDRAIALAPDLHDAAIQKGYTYLLWQGQLDTLRAVLNRVPRDDQLLARISLLYWERSADSLLQVLKVSRADVIEGLHIFRPSSLYAGWAHQLRGDRPAARAAFDSARALLDSVMRDRPDDDRVHAARGLALAGLGRREEALREARWLQQSVVYREDAFWGPRLAEDRARILAQVGDTEGAVDEVERLLAGPSWLSAHGLRLDPCWDPIRDHPRLRA